MPSGHKLPVFVSSTHYGLEDLRAELTDFLTSLGVAPFVSSESGFPDHPGMPPYAGCLRTLERCLFVVGVIDRRYGAKFDEWGPFPEYSGLSPTHAELRHAMVCGKRMVVYVRDDVGVFYELFRKNQNSFAAMTLPPGLDVETLQMYQELKLAKPAPWIESFRDVRVLKQSLQQRLLNDLYELMLQREATTTAAVDTIAQAFLKSDPSLREAVMAAAGQGVQAEIAALDEELRELERKRAERTEAREAASLEASELAQRFQLLASERVRLIGRQSRELVASLAAAIQGGLPPAALHRRADEDTLPLVSDQELSRGGIHFSGYSQAQPVATKVTWSKLPRQDSHGIGRGYDAALQMHGQGFAPGCRIQVRRRGSEDEPSFGWVPNIYSGHYLELSTSDSDETPIGDLGNEYRVINPVGRSTDWTPFTYVYDRESELGVVQALLSDGEKKMKNREFEAATEPLRSAHVRLAGLLGEEHTLWRRAHGLWRESLLARDVGE